MKAYRIEVLSHSTSAATAPLRRGGNRAYHRKDPRGQTHDVLSSGAQERAVWESY